MRSVKLFEYRKVRHPLPQIISWLGILTRTCPNDDMPSLFTSIEAFIAKHVKDKMGE